VGRHDSDVSMADEDQLTTSPALDSEWDIEAQLDKPLQTIDGFGPCFNELGWDSLSALDNEDKEAIFQELFAPGVGANFSICRMPSGSACGRIGYCDCRRCCK
jgi:O-glycosyl hydrolase